MAEFFSPGPGERLRAARLSMGYDLSKIASELHLTGPVIEALEADDYSGIGVRVFVRGYLRNYARIVGVPVESILRQFDEKWPDDSSRQAVVRESPTLPADAGPGRGLVGAMTWLLAIGLVVLFLMWWRGYLDEIVPEQIRTGGAAEEATVLESGGGDTVAPQPEAIEDAVLPDGSLRLPGPTAIETAPNPPVDSAAPAAAEPSPAPASLASTTLSLPDSAPATADPAADVATDDGPSAPAATGDRQVVLTFEAPCWVDVRDSERKFKLFGEMPKGTRKVLGGDPPYKMVIGNARAVDITVGGEPFDLAPYAKGNVARFTLAP